MLYNAPTGSTDPNAPYVGKNVGAGQQGSKVPPPAIEHTQREIVATIVAAGLTPSGADLQQLLRAVRGGKLQYFVDTSTSAGAPAIAPDPAHTSLFDGLFVRVKMKFPSNGPTNLTVNGLTAPIKRMGNVALVGGEWAANDIVGYVYSAAATAFQIQGLTANDVAQAGGGSAQVRLAMTNGTTLSLSPLNGNTIVVNGGVVRVPSAGVQGANTNVSVNGVAGQSLAASTAYYVSLAIVSGTPVLRFWNASTYGHMPDTTAGNIGVEVISNGGTPLSTDSLIGMVYTSAASLFQDTDGARYLLSWFNRRRKRSNTGFSANRSTTSTSYLELNSEIRNGFIVWANDFVEYAFTGSYGNNAASYNAAIAGVSFDGAAPEVSGSLGTPYNLAAPTGVSNAAIIGCRTGLAETAAHYATLFAQVQGNTGTWYAADSVGPTLYTAAAKLSIIVNG